MTEYLSVVVIVVAVICTLISVITEFTKEVGFLRRIPTDLQVLALSIILCVVTYFAGSSYYSYPVVWYHVVAVVFASFVIALVCSKGWTYLFNIWLRYQIKGGGK